MCNNIRYLAELDQFRFLAICEHEMLHLGWDHAIFYLSPDAFASLQEILAEVTASDHLAGTDNGVYWLHLYDFALQLTPKDLRDLATLVKEATQELPGALGSGLLDTEVELIWETILPEAAALPDPFTPPTAKLFSLN